MALEVQPPDGRKRVKVYELKDNDWFDRGTGFCTGQILGEEPRIFVESEDLPNRVLLETRITKDDGYQKQQGTYPTMIVSSLFGVLFFTNWITQFRDFDCLDRAEWHGYGAQFPRGGRLCGHLVRNQQNSLRA
jgi:hypothetical protein